MKNGKCSRCGSATVVARPNGIVPGGSSREYINFEGRTYMPVDTAAYLCTTCGYYERYVTDPGKLAQAGQTWQKVPPQG